MEDQNKTCLIEATTMSEQAQERYCDKQKDCSQCQFFMVRTFLKQKNN